MTLEWDMKPRQRNVIALPLEAECDAKASSSYTRETIVRRLQTIRDDPGADEERQFLRELLEREDRETGE